MIADGVYVPSKGLQPVCAGLDALGELLWNYQEKALWHRRMFPVTYSGDFAIEWMWKSAYEKGMEWEEAI